MKVVALGVAGVVAFVAAVGGAMVLFSLAVLGADAEPGDHHASPAALADIPPELLSVYRQAAESCGMAWSVLAAVGKTESDHGRSALAGVRSGSNQSGAMGPMQFLANTWAAYGVDADHDGSADVYGDIDAIWGAARYLCANGASDPARVRSALWRYNHADWYVAEVLEVAAGYRAGEVSDADARALVDHPGLTLTPRARRDLLDGVIDQRVVDFLAWALSRHTISVSVLRTGHSKYVANTARVSSHWHGRGLDIYAVDGEPVTPSSTAARRLAHEVLDLGPLLRPTEVGLPWVELATRGGAFTDDDHLDHLHVGYEGN